MNDGDLMNEFKYHSTVNNLGTYFILKQPRWQQYQNTSNKKTS